MKNLSSRLNKLEGNIGHRLESPPVFQTDPETAEVTSAWVTGSGIIERHKGEELRIFEARVKRAFASRPGIDQMTDEALKADLDFLKAHIRALFGMTDAEIDSAIESTI